MNKFRSLEKEMRREWGKGYCYSIKKIYSLMLTENNACLIFLLWRGVIEWKKEKGREEGEKEGRKEGRKGRKEGRKSKKTIDQLSIKAIK